ncbi:Ubiquitin carboxyl-terminal hydrolase 42, partial [Irineochytrium annulatum]
MLTACLAGHPKLEEKVKEETVIHQIFGGYLQSQVKCMKCGHPSNTSETVLDISLEIKKCETLEKAFRHFTKPELLTKDNRYRCSKCKVLVDAQKKLGIATPPLVLVLHLKRFDFGISSVKIDRHIKFPIALDVRPFLCEPAKNKAAGTYTLIGVLVHSGHGIHSGHYFSYIKASNGLWYLMNDSEVRQVSQKTVLDQKAYMLFYETVPPSKVNAFIGAKGAEVKPGSKPAMKVEVAEVSKHKKSPLADLDTKLKSVDMNAGIVKKGAKDLVLYGPSFYSAGKLSSATPHAPGANGATLGTAKAVLSPKSRLVGDHVSDKVERAFVVRKDAFEKALINGITHKRRRSMRIMDSDDEDDEAAPLKAEKPSPALNQPIVNGDFLKPPPKSKRKATADAANDDTHAPSKKDAPEGDDDNAEPFLNGDRAIKDHPKKRQTDEADDGTPARPPVIRRTMSTGTWKVEPVDRLRESILAKNGFGPRLDGEDGV